MILGRDIAELEREKTNLEKNVEELKEQKHVLGLKIESIKIREKIQKMTDEELNEHL